MDTHFTIPFQQILSDCLFGATLTSLFLVCRKRALTIAFRTSKMTTFTKSILAFEKARQIKSGVFYIKRTGIYVAGASLVDSLGGLTELEGVCRFGKGLLWGILFCSWWVGVVLGAGGTGVGYVLQTQLRELL